MADPLLVHPSAIDLPLENGELQVFTGVGAGGAICVGRVSWSNHATIGTAATEGARHVRFLPRDDLAMGVDDDMNLSALGVLQTIAEPATFGSALGEVSVVVDLAV